MNTPPRGQALVLYGIAGDLAWRIVDPALDVKTPPEPYDRGGWGPPNAGRLPRDGHWISPQTATTP